MNNKGMMDMKLKRIICFITLICVAVTSVIAGAQSIAYKDVEDGAYYKDAATVLTGFKIISGDGDGNLRPYSTITRGEFAKLAVGMLNEIENAKAASAGISYFSDVYNGYWALPFINYVADKNIIVGYSNGTFAPDNNITYGEALTVVLRILGYDDSVITGFWPDSYVLKAAALSVTEGMTFDAAAPITRADAFVIIAKALETKTNGSNKMLMETYGFSKTEDTVILATSATDKNISSDKVLTSDGTFKFDGVDMNEYIGQTVNIYRDDENNIVSVVPTPRTVKKYVIKKVLGSDKYLCVSDGAEESIKFDSDFTVYTKSGKSTYSGHKNEFVVGASLSMFKKDGADYDYAMLSDADDIEPVTAFRDYAAGDTSVGGIEISDINTVTVYRDGYLANLSDIKKYDVIYYNPIVNTMDVYIDKVTGLYEKAYPSKAYITSIEVGGNTYELGSDVAIGKLDESTGSFAINDVITLLFGKDGKVVDVYSKYADVKLDYAVVKKTYTSIEASGTNKGATVYEADLVMSDSKVYTYKTKKQYSDYEGKLVSVKFEGEYAVLSTFTSQDMYGYLDTKGLKFSNLELTDDVVIFNRKDTNNGFEVEALSAEDVDSTYVASGEVYGYVKSLGKIAVLYVSDITNDDTKYAIFVSRSKVNDSTYTYKMIVDGETQEYTKQGAYSVMVGLPTRLTFKSGTLKGMQSLVKIKSGAIDEYAFNKITIDGSTYDVDGNNVMVYSSNSKGEYYTVATSVLEDGSVKTATVYADTVVARGGVVRAIYVKF